MEGDSDSDLTVWIILAAGVLFLIGAGIAVFYFLLAAPAEDVVGPGPGGAVPERVAPVGPVEAFPPDPEPPPVLRPAEPLKK